MDYNNSHGSTYHTNPENNYLTHTVWHPRLKISNESFLQGVSSLSKQYKQWLVIIYCSYIEKKLYFEIRSIVLLKGAAVVVVVYEVMYNIMALWETFSSEDNKIHKPDTPIRSLKKS